MKSFTIFDKSERFITLPPVKLTETFVNTALIVNPGIIYTRKINKRFFLEFRKENFNYFLHIQEHYYPVYK